MSFTRDEDRRAIESVVDFDLQGAMPDHRFSFALPDHLPAVLRCTSVLCVFHPIASVAERTHQNSALISINESHGFHQVVAFLDPCLSMTFQRFYAGDGIRPHIDNSDTGA